jgi:translocation and assembly module TamA
VRTVTTDAVYGRIVDELIVPGITYAAVPESYLGRRCSRARYLRRSVRTAPSVRTPTSCASTSERQFDLTRKWHLLLRGELGTSLVKNFDEMPGIYRFFAGGDRSVRGFAYQSLSPTAVAADGTVEQMAAATITGTVELEATCRAGSARWSSFGNAFDCFGDPLAYSVGIASLAAAGGHRRHRRRAGAQGARLTPRPGPRLHLNISPRL